MEELFNFKGKIGRLEYFQVSLLCYLILFTFVITMSVIFKPGMPWLAFTLLISELILTGCVIAIKLAAVNKRIQDLALPQILTCIILIPFINILFSIYLLSAKGKKKKISENHNDSNTDVKTCIYCCAKIPAHAKKCMYCGEWVDFESFEEEMNRPNSYWTSITILFVLIAGLGIYSTNTRTTNIFSQEIFKTKNLADYYEDANEFCKKFKFDSTTQQYNCIYTYLEDNATRKMNKELIRINQNCRNIHSEETEYINCVKQAITGK